MTETTVIDSVIEDKLAKALEASNYRLTLNVQRENSKLKLKNKLVFAINGGIFKITQDFIAFVYALSQSKNSAVILDSNENPIKIDDLEEFFDEVVSVYQESMNDYLAEYEKFKKLRNTESVVNW